MIIFSCATANAQSDSFAVFFAPSKYQPDARQKAMLDSFLHTGKLQQAPSIVIMGYGDKTGGGPANMKISQLRATGILEYLAAHDIPKEKILSCQGLGIRDPNAGKDTSATDRRVNILLMRQPLDNQHFPGIATAARRADLCTEKYKFPYRQASCRFILLR